MMPSHGCLWVGSETQKIMFMAVPFENNIPLLCNQKKKVLSDFL